MAPKYLLVNFRSISEAHSHNTRSSSVNYHVSRDLAKSQGTFAFTATKAWNSLPMPIKCLTELKIFRRKLKDSLSFNYTNWLLRILTVHWINGTRPQVFTIQVFTSQVLSTFTPFTDFFLLNVMNYIFKGPCWKQVFGLYRLSFEACFFLQFAKLAL